MSKLWRYALRVVLVAVLALTTLAATHAAPGRMSHPRPIRNAGSGEWPMYLHDLQRSAAQVDDANLSPTTASQLTKLWSFQTGGSIAAEAAVVNNVVYVGSWNGYEYALSAASGALIWKTYLGQTVAPRCSPPSAGVTSSATVQNGIVYVGGGNAYWYALNASTGAILWKVYTGNNSARGGHYNWSSPLIYNGYAYIGVSSFGNCPTVQGQLLKVSLSTHRVVHHFNVVPTGQIGGGVWGSPALDPTTQTLYVPTGSEGVQPFWSQPLVVSLLALDATTLALKSSWQILPQALSDSDFGTTPTLFYDNAGTPLVGLMNKNGIFYTFKRANLEDGPLWQRRLAAVNASEESGIVSAAFDGRYLFVGGNYTTINGVGYPGSVRALDPATGALLWQHGLISDIIPALGAANGLVLAADGPALEVLSAQTGTRLYSYTTGGILFAAASESNGRIFVGSTDGNVYAFGLPATPPPTPVPDAHCPLGWRCQDMGQTSPPGSEAITGTTWAIQDGGAGLGRTGDQARFVLQQVSGNFQIGAEIINQTAPGHVGQAGLAVRQNMDPRAPEYGVLLTSAHQIVVRYRTAFGGGTVQVAKVRSRPLPLYLEIRHTSDQFTAAISPNGVTYTLVPGSGVTMALPTPVWTGLTASSGTQSRGGGAIFRGVSVTMPSVPPSTPIPIAPCPRGWTCTDVGNAGPQGSQSLSGTTWTVQGGGGLGINSTGPADEFHGVWQSLRADGSVSAHVVRFTHSDTGASAGIMVRMSTATGSAYYAALVTSRNSIAVQIRAASNALARKMVNQAGTGAHYLKIIRIGMTFTTYISRDGTTWLPLHGSNATLTMSGPLLAGIVATSHDYLNLTSATFDTVTLQSCLSRVPYLCACGQVLADVLCRSRQ